MLKYFKLQKGRTKYKTCYFGQGYESDSKNHTSMNFARQASEDSSNRMNEFPKGEYYDAANSNNVVKFETSVVGF